MAENLNFLAHGALKVRTLSFLTSMSSHSCHHSQEGLLAQFSLYLHKSGLKSDLFHFISQATYSQNVGLLSVQHRIYLFMYSIVYLFLYCTFIYRTTVEVVRDNRQCMPTRYRVRNHYHYHYQSCVQNFTCETDRLRNELILVGLMIFILVDNLIMADLLLIGMMP